MDRSGRFDERLGRADQLASVLGIIVAAIAAVAGLLLDEPWDQRLLAGAAVLAAGAVLVVLTRWRKPSVTDEIDLDPWRVGVRNVMSQTWVGHGTPLDAIDDLRRDLHLTANDKWLHDRYRHATDLRNGDDLNLAETDGAGGLWELLDGSYVVVGDPGSGKSVLLWQTLDYLIDTYTPSEVTPLLIEAFQWDAFDTDPHGDLPRFEDFIAWRIQDPALGTPPELAKQLAGDIVLLLDGFDELADANTDKATRFIDSLDQAKDSQRISNRVVITTRPGQYQNLITKRGAGSCAVTYALEIEPYPIETIITTLEQLPQPATHLVEELNRLGVFRSLLQRPLWLALTLELYRQPWNTSPFAGLTDPTEQDCQQVLYRAWLNNTSKQHTDTWRRHVGFLATRMTTGVQTLTLEQIQGQWLPPQLRPTFQRLNTIVYGLVLGLVFGPVFGLVAGLVVGLAGLVIGLACGLVFGLVAGSVGGTDFGLGGVLMVEPVARQRFDPRRFRNDHALVGLVFGLVFGLAVGLACGLVVGLACGLACGLFNGDGNFVALPANGPPETTWSVLLADARVQITRGLLDGLLDGLVSGMGFGLVGALVGALGGALGGGMGFGLVGALGFGLVGGLGFGRGGLVAGLVVGMVFGLGFGLVFGMGFGLVGALGVGLGSALGFGLVVGMVFGLVFGLFDGLFDGLGVGLVEGLRFGLFFGLVGALVYELVGGLVVGLVGALVFGLGFGLVFGLVDGLSAGLSSGLAVLHHLIARLTIKRAGLLPFGLVGFLNGLVDDGLMYRVGAGYRFRHRTLSRWLADEWYTENIVDLTDADTSRQPRTQTQGAQEHTP